MRNSTYRPLRQRARLAIYTGIALGAITIVVVAILLYNEREAARRQAEQQASNIALALERDIGRVIADFDLSLKAAMRGMQVPNLQNFEPEIRQAILFDGAVSAEGIGGVFIADEHGTVIFESDRPEARPINLADREYFQALRQTPDHGLVISHPVISRADGLWTMALARRLNHADGSFAGVVAGGVRLNFLQSLFETLDLGKNSVLNLVTTDGVMIARRPLVPEDIGRDMRNSKMLTYLALNRAGTFEATASVDGERRLYAYRQIGQFPLVIGVGMALYQIDAPWRIRAATVSAVLITLAALGLGAGWLLQRELGRRERAEAANRLSERRHAEALARLDALFSNSNDAMVVARVAPNGMFVYEAVNPIWELISGIPQVSAIGQTPEACLPAELANTVLHAWRTCVSEKRRIPFTFQAKMLGDWRDWEANIAPVLDGDGVVKRIIAVARDVTDNNRLEASLRQSQRMEAVGQLTAGVAHDFNNLLQCVSGALELMQDQPELSHASRRHANIIDDAVSRGSALVHHLLAFSRKQLLRPKIVDPHTIMNDLAPLFSSLLGGTIQVAIEIDEAPWPVRADAAQLQNCLLNLVLNARDAMLDCGEICVRVHNEGVPAAQAAGLSPVEHLCFTVEDHGEGMDTETLSRALEPFFTTKPVGQGTGLGLSMVQGFAKQSGGDVTIKSAVGRGTTVCLWLPRVLDASLDVAVTSGIAATYEPRVRRVMIVDDVAAVRETLVTMLTHAGLSAIAVGGGDSALALLRSGEPCDLLVTDQSMPGLKGSDLILHAAQLRPELPTMLITGYDKVTGLDLLPGRVTVLRKPFRRAAFMNQVNALLASEPLVVATPQNRPNLVMLQGKTAGRM